MESNLFFLSLQSNLSSIPEPLEVADHPDWKPIVDYLNFQNQQPLDLYRMLSIQRKFTQTIKKRMNFFKSQRVRSVYETFLIEDYASLLWTKGKQSFQIKYSFHLFL